MGASQASPPKEGVEAVVIRNDTDDVGSAHPFFCVWVFEFFVDGCILHEHFSVHGNSKTLELALTEQNRRIIKSST